MDLWSFDEEEMKDSEPAAGPPKIPDPVIPASRKVEQARLVTSKDEIPASRKVEQVRVVTSDDEIPTPRLGGKNDSIRTNIGMKRGNLPSEGPPTQLPELGEFGDLDQWNDPEPAPPAMPVLAPVAPMPVQRETRAKSAALMEGGDLPASSEKSIAAPTEESTPPQPDSGESAPAATERPEPPTAPKGPAKPAWSTIERIGMGALVVILLAVAVATYVGTIGRIPRVVENTRANDFPVVGKKLTILSADSYWREPVIGGPNADTFRRDTVLLPEVVLTSSGGPAVIRLFFRDGEGRGVGDAVSRTLQPGEKVRITATAGFDDMGMHTAYRISDGKRWTIEVMEEAGAGNFQKLFTMNISSDRH